MTHLFWLAVCLACWGLLGFVSLVVVYRVQKARGEYVDMPEAAVLTLALWPVVLPFVLCRGWLRVINDALHDWADRLSGD